jgi:peroxiredoxin
VVKEDTSMEPSNNQEAAPPLAMGTVAPDFELSSSQQPRVKLSELRGRPAILAFYPADWSPVCGDQMVLYQQILPEFEKHHATMLGISVDGVWCHKAWSQNRNISFPLLSDFEPKGDVSRSYNAYHSPEGVSERALFVIDPNGRVCWSYISPITVNPGADGILRALESMEPGG